MKIDKIISDYENLKKLGVVKVVKNNLKETVIVSNKYSEDTGEITGQNTHLINIDEIAIQIENLELKLNNFKELMKDL